MLTQYEVEKLRRQMHPELNPTWVTLVRCLAGLLIVLALGLFGRQIDLHRDSIAPASVAQPAAAVPISSAAESAAETQESFDMQPVTHVEAASVAIPGRDVREAE